MIERCHHIYGANSFIAKRYMNLINDYPSDEYIQYSKSLKTNNELQTFSKSKLSSFREHIWIHFSALARKTTSIDETMEVAEVNIKALTSSLRSFNLLKFKRKKFLFISSDRVGCIDKIFNEKSSIKNPVDGYGLSKSLCEDIVKYAMNNSKEDIYKIVRITNVCGEGQQNNQLIPKLIRKGLNRENFDLGKVDGVRSFLDVDDVVRGIYKSATLNLDNENVIHLSNKPFELESIVNRCSQCIYEVVGFYPENISSRDNLASKNASPKLTGPLFSDEYSRRILNWQPELSVYGRILEYVKRANEQKRST